MKNITSYNRNKNISGIQFSNLNNMHEEHAVVTIQNYLSIVLSNKRLSAKYSLYIGKFHSLPEESRKRISLFLYERFSRTGNLSMDSFVSLVKNEVCVLEHQSTNKTSRTARKKA